MARFVTTVDAFRLGGTEPMPGWLRDAEQRGEFWLIEFGGAEIYRAGDAAQHVGRTDWVIQDAAGRLTSCKPDEFDAAYRPAEASNGNDA